MEGFTIVLLIGWALLLGSFVGMYFLDQAVKHTAERRSAPSPQTPDRSR